MHGKVTPKKKKNELFLLALQEYGSSFLDFDCISFVIQLLQTVTTSNTCSRKKKLQCKNNYFFARQRKGCLSVVRINSDINMFTR